ncbi:hypothetical protein N7532_010706 [Penicillium argentinense]|uniref:Uncharacterized protein n=1 Tax=Penicillium argentinense TaxID=1131581 RepID=A0A9W9JYA9_9EURO|nr:uncharacterized protein N7532_010706 [Penicillium argentinense]KAJ5085935.1 hypothetical protein N7532_010706 [Penicillium argentinense]
MVAAKLLFVSLFALGQGVMGLAAAATVMSWIKVGKETASKIDSLNSSDSDKLEEAVNSLSQIVFSSLLDGFVAKKSVFQKAVLGRSADGLVEKDLRDLKDATDGFGNAIISIISSDFKKDAPHIVEDLDNHFDHAIKAFSS